MPEEAPVMTATGVDLFAPYLHLPLIANTTGAPAKRTLGKMLLELLVGCIVGLLILAGVAVMMGPNLKSSFRRLRTVRRPIKVPSVFQSQQREAVPSGLNAKTQRVVVAAARLSTWLRAHGQEDLSREIRTGAARLTTNEPAGLYALQTSLRKIRALSIEDSSQQRLKALSSELRTAVQDRFEQLELLPFKRP
jgi:hypothetical protein